MDMYFNDATFLTTMDDDPRNPDIFTSMKAFEDRYFGGENGDMWSPNVWRMSIKRKYTPKRNILQRIENIVCLV